MLASGILAAALLHAYRLALPPRTDLVTAVHRWDHARARATRVQRIGPAHDGSMTARLGVLLAEQLSRRTRDLTALNQDLAVTGATLEGYLSRSLSLAILGLISPTAILSILNAAGAGLPVFTGPLLGLVLSTAMVGLGHRELRETAAKRRTEFRRGLSIYLDLVAMSMQAGRGHSEALPAAAAIGTGVTFTELQDVIEGARFSGTTAWAALGQLGQRFGIRELSDLDGALQLANDDGAKVRATLIARATTLREQRIADARAAAAQATESMKFTLLVMVFVFLAYELYPSLARLFTG